MAASDRIVDILFLAGKVSPIMLPNADIEGAIPKPLRWGGLRRHGERSAQAALMGRRVGRSGGAFRYRHLRLALRARYVDDEGDFAYAPYGLDILEDLVKASTTVKTIETKALAANKPNLEPFAALARTPTKVGRLLFGLCASTKAKDIEELATLSVS